MDGPLDCTGTIADDVGHNEIQQEKQRKYNRLPRCVRVTTVAVKKQ
jgi:hypothetical protein